MAIQLARSNTTGHLPASLQDGQLAINQVDDVLFSRKPDGTVRRFLLPKRSGIADVAYPVRVYDTYVGIGALTAARQITLPAASSYPAGQPLTIADESGACSPSNIVTLAFAAGVSNTINGAATLPLSTAYFGATLFSDGISKWTATGLPAAGAANALLYVPQALTNAQQNQIRTNIGGFSLNDDRLMAMQIATNKGSLLSLLTGFADGYADTSGIDLVNSANVTRDAPTNCIVNQASEPNTKSLLHFDGANNSTTITDDVPGHTITVSGGAKLSTTQKVFGTASLLCASTGDYVSMASSTDFGFGTGDFTINIRVYFTSLGANRQFFDTKTGSSGFEIYYRSSSGTLALYNWGTSSTVLIGTTTIVANTWYDVEVSRASGTMRLFINGVQEATATDNSNFGTTQQVRIGAEFDGGQFLGYIDEFRVSNIARHASNFTPATGAFVAGTSGALDLRSVITTLQSTPTRGSLFIVVRPTADAISPNTNLIGSLSRDGAAFGDVVLAQTAALPGGFVVLEANEVDLTGISAGVSLRARVRTVGTSLGVAVDGIVALAR